MENKLEIIIILVLLLVIVFMTIQYNKYKTNFENFASGSPPKPYIFVPYQEIIDPPNIIISQVPNPCTFDTDNGIDSTIASTYRIQYVGSSVTSGTSGVESGMYQYGIDPDFNNLLQSDLNPTNNDKSTYGAFRLNYTDIFHINGQDTQDSLGSYYGYFVDSNNNRLTDAPAIYKSTTPGKIFVAIPNGILEVGNFTNNPPVNFPTIYQYTKYLGTDLATPFIWSSCAPQGIKPVISTFLGPIDPNYKTQSTNTGINTMTGTDDRTHVLFDADGLNYITELGDDVCNAFTHIKFTFTRSSGTPYYFKIIPIDTEKNQGIIFDIYGYFVDENDLKLPFFDPLGLSSSPSTAEDLPYYVYQPGDTADIKSLEPGFYISTISTSSESTPPTNLIYPDASNGNIFPYPSIPASQRTFCRWLRPSDSDNINHKTFCQQQYNKSTEVIVTENCFNKDVADPGVGIYTTHLPNLNNTETYYYNNGNIYVQPGQVCPDPFTSFENYNK
jgi:hypothetical protein